MDPYTSFEQFWPFYVAEHSRPLTRWMHFAGTSIGLLCLIAFVATLDWRYLVAGLVAGYALAWLSHFLVEKNKPATFRYPLWSLVADWKMWMLMLSRRM